jgi:hypothetical protein
MRRRSKFVTPSGSGRSSAAWFRARRRSVDVVEVLVFIISPSGRQDHRRIDHANAFYQQVSPIVMALE